MGKEHEKTGPRTTPEPADKKSKSGATNRYPVENRGSQDAHAGKAVKESETEKSKRTQADGLT